MQFSGNYFYFNIELIDASKGSVKVTVIAAQSLTKKQLAAVQEGVVKIVGSSKVPHIDRYIHIVDTYIHTYIHTYIQSICCSRNIFT